MLKAAVLVFRDGVDYILRGLQKNSIDLYNEHKVLKKMRSIMTLVGKQY